MKAYQLATEALVAACAGKNLTKVSGLWDTLASFAAAVGMNFPEHRREAVMTAAGSMAAKSKGTMTGGSSVTRHKASVGDAWKAAVTHAAGRGASTEDLKSWAADWQSLSAVAAFAKGTTKVKFEV